VIGVLFKARIAGTAWASGRGRAVGALAATAGFLSVWAGAAAAPAVAEGAASIVATDASPSLSPVDSVAVAHGAVVYTAVDGARRVGARAGSAPLIPFTGSLRRIAADPNPDIEELPTWSLAASRRWVATMVDTGAGPPKGGTAARLDGSGRAAVPRACGGTVSVVGDRVVYVQCKDRSPIGKVVAYDLRKQTTTRITRQLVLDPVAAGGWVAYTSYDDDTEALVLAPLREATRPVRVVASSGLYDVQADGKLAFIVGTPTCHQEPNGGVLEWTAPHTPATTLAPCVSTIGLAIAADRVLAMDTTQTPYRVTRWALDGSIEVLATVDAGSIRALDDDGTTAAVVQHACGQERVVLLTGGTGPADLTSAACPGP
jgi:hypothetical protein